ncbi:murein biosynthesis integral membrane protein MurJ [bacterium]|nr:murein biosynthesis integral membrane protein MurJ [bacterium]
MMQKLFNNKILNGSPVQSVAGAALIISFAGIISRLLGMLRDRILASQFGAGDTLDIYYAAFRIPDLVYSLLVVGALSAAFIPVFTGLIAKHKKEKAWELASGILNLMVAAVIFISFFLALFAPFVMKLVVPGFSENKLASVAMFTRIMFLSPLFLGISAVFGGILVSFKKFLAYSLAPIMYNLGIIIGAVFLVKIMGPIGLAWGVALGAGMHLFVQYPAVKLSGFHYQLNFRKSFRDENARKVIRLMIPRSMGMAVTQINMLVITIFASILTSGSLAVFNFANNIQSVPLGLFGISFAVAAFPHLSSLAAEKSKKEFIRIFSRTFRRIIFFVAPLSLLIFILRAEIVRVILGAGKFDWEDTVLTLQVLGILSLSLIAQSLIPLLARAFYALQNTKIPFYIALASEAVNIFMVILLIKKYELMGLAIAFSIASILNAGLLTIMLRKKLGELDGRKIIRSAGKILIASVMAGLITQTSRYFISYFISLETFFEVFFQLIISGGMGMTAFLLMCCRLRVEEFYDFKKSIFIKIFGYPTDVIKDPNEIK